MIICPNCGKEISEDVVHCGHCGNKMTTDQKKTMVGLGAVDPGEWEKRLEENRKKKEREKAQAKSAPEKAEAEKADTEDPGATEMIDAFKLPTPKMGRSEPESDGSESDQDALVAAPTAAMDAVGGGEESSGGLKTSPQEAAPPQFEAEKDDKDDSAGGIGAMGAIGGGGDGIALEETIAPSQSSPFEKRGDEESAPEAGDLNITEGPVNVAPSPAADLPQDAEDASSDEGDEGKPKAARRSNIMEMRAGGRSAAPEPSESALDSVGEKEGKSRQRMLIFIVGLVVVGGGCCMASFLTMYVMDIF